MGLEMNGAERIAAERKRQIEVEGFTAERDDSNGEEELAITAACYVLPKKMRLMIVEEDEGPFMTTLLKELWPWDLKYWKPTPDNRIRELEKAGALIAAEIDRLLRLEEEKK